MAGARRRERLVFRALARAEVEAAANWYAEQAGSALAEAFVAEVERVCALIAREPAMGSPRWGDALGLHGLRSWSLRRFPYLVFYVERRQQIEIWRVLHSTRDIPVTLAEPEPPSA